MQYTIKHAYPFADIKHEVEIKSDNLLYTEIGTTHNGLQCDNLENHSKIRKECVKIANAIRKIEQLNK